MSQHHPIAHRDFSGKTLKALASRGIYVIGSQAAPAFEGDKYFSDVSYSLNDNDAYCIRRHSDVIALARLIEQ